MVTVHAAEVNLERVQMHMTPAQIPPLYIGAMREKSLRLAGRAGDGTILTGMSSPAYIHWAREHVRAGMAETGRTHNRLVTYLDVKVNSDGIAARAAMRKVLASRLPWADVHLNALGIAEEVASFIRERDADEIALHMPDAWVDAFSAAGTPEQVAEAVQRIAGAGLDSIVFAPLNGDPVCLDEYIRYLMPLLKPDHTA
jgi:alkanesulfonate monooxygenase SsuD/methylene tetrahydromethanopterin reductase-like flavin-dependent oxidoreductase (luciferase family)